MSVCRVQSPLLASLRLAGAILMGVGFAGSVCGEARADELPLFTLSGEPPPGFSHLVERQSSLVDVFSGGRFLVSTIATYTPDTIAFEAPGDITAELSALSDPEAITAGLGGELSTHGELICVGGTQPGCGELRPEIVGVIYDADRFRADLFVNPDHLVTRVPTRDRYLPAAQSRLTLLQNFSATFAGADDADTVSTFGSFTTVAMGESRFETIASYTEHDDLTIDRMFFARDYRGMEYVSGLFRTSGRALAFMGENDLGGVRIASSLRTRADLAFARGSPITVFLAAGSRVDIIKDGRLLSSSFYPAGNQVLDTSGLPDGSYDITIRIDDGGSPREEVRFFSKTVRIPPMDQPLSFFEMGRVLERSTTELFPEDTDAWLARLGHSRRVTENLGLDAGIAATEDEQLLELGVFYLGQAPRELGFYELQASAFVDAEADYGLARTGNCTSTAPS